MDPRTEPLRRGQATPEQPGPVPLPAADTDSGTRTHPLRAVPASDRPATPPPPPVDPLPLPSDFGTTSLPAFARQFTEQDSPTETARVHKPCSTNPTEEVGPPEIDPATIPCPRCGHAPLVSPLTLGLCSRCGYCRSIEEDRDTLARVGAAVELPIAPPPPSVWEQVPGWAHVLAGGSAVVVVGSVAVSLQLSDPATRAIWSAGQFVLGLVLLFAAQWWGLVHVAPANPRLGVGDLFLISGRLWSAVGRDLPATCGQLWMGVWGLLLMVCEAFVVGGLGWWIEPHP